jgi:hypothetical protein
MAERLGPVPRRTGGRASLLVVGAMTAVLLGGCGDVPGDRGLNDLPKTDAASCLSDDQVGSSPILTSADLDGTGEPDAVQFAEGSGTCHDVLFARADAKRRGVVVTGDLPMTAAKASPVTVPGRKGQLVLVVQSHPRGGFQARLFGYADGRLEELTADGAPVFPFVATDVLTDPMSASCTEGGFEVVEAKAHAPIGVVPAWDVYRTTYAVDGNTVTKGATAEVADNVLDKQLHREYRALVQHSLFANCRSAG